MRGGEEAAQRSLALRGARFWVPPEKTRFERGRRRPCSKVSLLGWRRRRSGSCVAGAVESSISSPISARERGSEMTGEDLGK